MADVEDMFDDAPGDSKRYSSDEDDETHGLGTRRREPAVASDADADEDEDEDEDEDKDDEDEDDEDGGRHARKKAKGGKGGTRRKRRRANNFLDIEATVDTDDEEEDDEDGALGDFIVDNEEELATAEKDALRQRAAARPAVFQDETLDADAIEAQLRERYSGYAAGGQRGAGAQIDADWVPQRLIIPGINDPHLWMARCLQGKERDVVLAAGRRMLAWAGSDKYRGVYSVYSRDGLAGYVYVEARTQADAHAALEGIQGVFLSKLALVPIEDMVDVVKVKTHTAKLNPGSWVRVKRGNYAGDLAQVVSVIESSDAVEVRLLPRLDYDGGRGDKRARPAQRLFSVEEAQRADPRGLSSRQNEILWRGDRFVGGYLHKDMRTISLQTADVNPTLEEIALFAAGEAGEDGDEQAAIAALASQAAAAAAGVAAGLEEANGLSARDVQPGERVEVVEGDLAGLAGTVRSVEAGDVVCVEPDTGGAAQQRQQQQHRARRGVMRFPARQLRKRFAPGDHVKVLNGRHASETGMVVNVADAVVTVYTDVGQREIRVLARDLRVSSDVGTGAAAGAPALVGLDVHDLVHLDGTQMGVVLRAGRDTLTVLDDNNETRTLPVRAVRPVRGGFERTGADYNGAPLRRGDVAREAAGARRQGTVVQVTRFVAFLKLQGADAIVAVRTRQTESLTARHASLDPYATRTLRPGPAASDAGRGRGRGGGRMGSLRGGRNPLVGKTVIPNRGPYKGYAGIIKDVTGAIARVELHSNARIVPVDKDKLSVRLPSGETIPVPEYEARQMDAHSSGASSMPPPSAVGSVSGGGGGGGGGGGWDSASMSGGGGGWDTGSVAGGAPRSSYTPAASGSASGGGGGWDTGSVAGSSWGGPPRPAQTPAGTGGWDAPTPANAGGWDAPTPSASGSASASGGWGAGGGVGGGASGSWSTPAPFTPGALPQTPGGFPQTPGASHYGGGPSEPAPAADGFFGWAVPRAVVVLGASGQRGTIQEVAPERQQAIIRLESGATQVVDRSSVARLDPRPVRAEKRDRVIVIRGPRKGALGIMVGKDGADAYFEPDGDQTWHTEPQRNLAIYSDAV
ncbi:transcription elongation factor spt5 [Coemansia javaensis]|uniref:Transcription elongation factor SPT5 n=1 Tax=Coemansia javaensis TaxID=2761396 RepID=A0A9W8HF22_9FUNG|nr:transcription elongation factor spt5 [Coemansia javaensis]